MLSRAPRGLAAVLASLAMLAGTSLQAQERPPASVQIARAAVRDLAPAVRAAGIVRSRAAADLSASVAGRLQWVAEAGTTVAAGELVARLDTRELAL
ncbi:MAG: rane fusion protein multidrug efflux system, partial [Pseudomonadota bacterium]|nr:rane fusion protein multidrug efflux system [Pseudomonadota bacterium]